MAILKSNKRAFGFLLSEANDYRSRDQIAVDFTAVTDDLVPAGTLLTAGATATAPHVVWDGATGDPSAILALTVEGGMAHDKVTVISRDAVVIGAELFPETFDTAKLEELGIVVRYNVGMTLAVQAPS